MNDWVTDRPTIDVCNGVLARASDSGSVTAEEGVPDAEHEIAQTVGANLRRFRAGTQTIPHR